MKVGAWMSHQESLWGEPRCLPDPRSDKMDDHGYWEELLLNSWNIDRALHFLLHGIRCGGAEVMRTQKGFHLMPGEWNGTEWEEIKRDKLSPFRDKLINVFKLTRFGRVTDEKIPDGFFDKERSNKRG